MRRLPVIIAFLIAAPWAARSAAAELSGRLELSARKGGASPAEAVVYFEPDQAVASRPSEEVVTMATRGKAFDPSVLVITRGSTVRFPNFDPILHNVFSVSPGNRFDLGFYRRGDSKTWTFETPGLVRVFCNVHYSMTAHILVLETPFFTTPGADGAFRLEGLPAGGGTLRVWHENARPWSEKIRIPAAAPMEIRIEVSRRRIVPHTNKYGKPYQRRGRNEYR